jgi:hypothetical protein
VTTAEAERFGLRWAIKPSFVGYVARARDGRAYLSDGAAVNEDNELLFELDGHTSPVEHTGAAAPAADDGADGHSDHTFTFRGDVRFTAHYGMLFVRIARPRVTLRGTEGELTVVDPESPDGAARLRLVTFTVAGPAVQDGVRRWDAADVQLTAEGAVLFGEVYQASEPFAPLMITIPATTTKDQQP